MQPSNCISANIAHLNFSTQTYFLEIHTNHTAALSTRDSSLKAHWSPLNAFLLELLLRLSRPARAIMIPPTLAKMHSSCKVFVYSANSSPVGSNRRINPDIYYHHSSSPTSNWGVPNRQSVIRMDALEVDGSDACKDSTDCRILHFCRFVDYGGDEWFGLKVGYSLSPSSRRLCAGEIFVVSVGNNDRTWAARLIVLRENIWVCDAVTELEGVWCVISSICNYLEVDLKDC